MSLEGLDSEAIVKAYETATSESAGWFLLKYASRNEVELLKTGSGGYVEAREVIAEYGEPSPLFGLVMHRRKKILVKYVPEGTSRLLQARLSVHLQSVIEAFVHDDLVSLTSSSDLTETALSSATSLKSSASFKALTNRKKPLSEIIEDGSESVASHPAAEIQEEEQVSSTRPITQILANGITEEKTEILPTKEDPDLQRSSRTDSPEEQLERPSTAHSTKASLDEERYFLRNSLEVERPSTQSTTSSPLKDPYVPYTYKPKVKLGPRPSIDSSNSTRGSGSFTRPVSTLPAGVTMPPRKTTGFDSPQAQVSNSHPLALGTGRTVDLSTLAAAEAKNVPYHTSPTSPAQSSFHEPLSPTFAGETPQNKRLMKALQRKRLAVARKASDGKLSEVSSPELTTSPRQESARPESEQVARVETENNEANGLGISQGPTDSPVGQVGSTWTKSVDTAETPSETEGEKVRGSDVVCNGSTTSPTLSMDKQESSAISVPLNGQKETQSTREELNELESNDGPQQESNNATSKQDEEIVVIKDFQHESPVLPVVQLAVKQKATEEKVEIPATAAESGAKVAPDTNNQHNVAPSNPADEVSLAASDPPSDDPNTTDSEDLMLPIQTNENTNEKTNKRPVAPLEVVQIFSNDGDSPTAPTITPADLRENRTIPLIVDTVDHSNSEAGKRKRLQPIQPIQPIEPTKFDSSDAASLSEDSLYDELQSATVHEAKPMIVSRSPATPVFPTMRRPSESSLSAGKSTPIDSDAPPLPVISPELKKSISDNMPSPRNIEDAQSLRSVSASSDAVGNGSIERGPSPLVTRFPSRTPSVSTNGTVERVSSKKSAVSSLISSRIKAFENISSSGAKSQPKAARPLVTSSIVSSRKSSLNTPPSSSGNDAIRPPSGTYPTPSPSPNNFVMRTFGSRKAPTTDPKTVEDGQATIKASRGLQRPRLDRSQGSQSSVASSTASSIVSSPPAIPMDTTSNSTSFFSRSRKKSEAKSKSKSNRSSVSSISSAVLESLKSPSRNSFSSKRSSKSRRSSSDTIRPSPVSLLSPSIDGKSIMSSTEKEKSKKSNLLKRMSSSLTFSSRKSVSMSPNLNEQPITEGVEPSKNKWTSMVLGEVNIQFPDHLLWKRRHLEIDDHSYLILSPSKTDKTSKVSIKRYHISEFKCPYIPDQDREELPFSVILDFQDNSTLQCACEHAEGQHEVLKVFLDCYTAFVSKDH